MHWHTCSGGEDGDGESGREMGVVLSTTVR